MNPRTIILILSINLAAGCSGADDPVSRSRQEPIVGGQLDPGHLPVGLVLQIGTQGYTSCTGTLIGPKTVLTAKHCVVGGPSAWFQLQDKVASSKEVYYSKLLQLHPTEDVALVLLKDPVLDHSNATSSKPAAVKPMKIVTASEPQR